jgi:signal transduction histidine kinase
MQERAELLGGKFAVEARPGSGTCVRVTIPEVEAEVEEA